MTLRDAIDFFVAPSESTHRLATPTRTYGSIFELDFEMFFKGMHLVSDWDGVWVPHNGLLGTDAHKKLEEAVAYCRTVSILSNCSAAREGQMKGILEPMGVRFFRAQPPKPSPEAFAKVFQARELTPSEIMNNSVYVGDSLYCDVYGANMAGFRHVLQVQPLPGNEPLCIRIARSLENIVHGTRHWL